MPLALLLPKGTPLTEESPRSAGASGWKGGGAKACGKEGGLLLLLVLLLLLTTKQGVAEGLLKAP